MKHFLRIIGIYAAFLLQSLIFENLNIFSKTPDIVVAAVIFAAIFLSVPKATVLGAFAGILTDAVCGRFFGMYTLLYMYLAGIVSFAVDKSTKNSPLICAWISFVSVAVYEIIIYLAMLVFGNVESVSGLGADIFVRGIFSALFSFFGVLLINRAAQKKSVPEEKEVAS